MPDRTDQAEAYLQQAMTTLDSARTLYQHDGAKFAPQIVKNGYDALEQAVSAGLAAAGESIPRSHPGKLLTFFELYDDDALEEAAFGWLSRRSEAQYVDFEGRDLSVPGNSFDANDAAEIIRDAEAMIEFVADETDLE